MGILQDLLQLAAEHWVVSVCMVGVVMLALGLIVGFLLGYDQGQMDSMNSYDEELKDFLVKARRLFGLQEPKDFGRPVATLDRIAYVVFGGIEVERGLREAQVRPTEIPDETDEEHLRHEVRMLEQLLLTQITALVDLERDFLAGKELFDEGWDQSSYNRLAETILRIVITSCDAETGSVLLPSSVKFQAVQRRMWNLYCAPEGGRPLPHDWVEYFTQHYGYGRTHVVPAASSATWTEMSG